MNDSDDNFTSVLTPGNIFRDSTGFYFLRTFGYLITAIISVPGNLLCLLVLPKTRSIPENNRLFLISLSIADFVVGILSSLAVVPAVLNKWPFGDVFCVVSLSLLGATSGISRNSLIGISIDRYLAVTKPLHYPMMVTRRKILIALACIWIFGILVLLLPFFGPPVMYRPNLALCVPVWTYTKYRSQAFVAFTVAFIIPCPIMFYIYARLFQITRQQLRALLMNQSVGVTGGQNAAAGILAKETIRKKGEAKAIRMFCAITFTFVLAWLPYLSLTLYNNLSGKEVSPLLEYFIVLAAMSSSWWDVVTLLGMNAGFRRTAHREIAKLFGCSQMAAQVEPSYFNSSTGGTAADAAVARIE